MRKRCDYWGEREKVERGNESEWVKQRERDRGMKRHFRASSERESRSWKWRVKFGAFFSPSTLSNS